MKLELWSEYLLKDASESFPAFSNFLSVWWWPLSKGKKSYHSAFSELKNSFQDYFCLLNASNKWFTISLMQP
jgi:hypothetical protein